MSHLKISTLVCFFDAQSIGGRSFCIWSTFALSLSLRFFSCSFLFFLLMTSGVVTPLWRRDLGATRVANIVIPERKHEKRYGRRDLAFDRCRNLDADCHRLAENVLRRGMFVYCLPPRRTQECREYTQSRSLMHPLFCRRPQRNNNFFDLFSKVLDLAKSSRHYRPPSTEVTCYTLKRVLI